jgi:hypothetical protein
MARLLSLNLCESRAWFKNEKPGAEEGAGGELVLKMP